MISNRLAFLQALTTPQRHALGVIRRLGCCSRLEIGACLQWHSPAVSKALKPMQDADLVLPEAVVRPQRGRRQDRLRLNPDWLCAVGVCLGFSNCSVALINLGGAIVARGPVRSLAGLDPAQIAALIREEADRLTAAHDGTPPLGLGIGFAGLTRGPNDLTRNFPDMAAWRHVPLARMLASPADAVEPAVQNDTIASLLAELRYGRALRRRDALLLHMDEGISLGVLSNGRIHQGHNQLCGEFGHIHVLKDGPFCYCGGTGCLESVASTWAMSRELRRLIDSGVHVGMHELGGGAPIGLELISQAAAQGETLARNLLGRAGDLIGGLLNTIVRILDPETVILAGKLSQIEAHPHLLAHIKGSVEGHLRHSDAEPVTIEPAELGMDAILIGAGALVFEQLMPAHPNQFDCKRQECDLAR